MLNSQSLGEQITYHPSLRVKNRQRAENARLLCWHQQKGSTLFRPPSNLSLFALSLANLYTNQYLKLFLRLSERKAFWSKL